MKLEKKLYFEIEEVQGVTSTIASTHLNLFSCHRLIELCTVLIY